MIPDQFKLMGQTINVKWVDDLTDEEDYVGLARYRKNEIILQKNNSGFYRPDSEIEATFYHELVHWILHFMGRKDLNKSENFIDLFGNLLHQALSTMEYDNNDARNKKINQNNKSSRKTG